MSTVVTYNGKTENQSDCVFIRGKFYHKERDCYLYNGVYYSPSSRYLVFDNETGNKLHVLEAKVEFGIVRFQENKPIFGHFSSNISKNCQMLIPESILKASEKEINEAIEEASLMTADYQEKQAIPEISDSPLGRRRSSPAVIIGSGARGRVKCMDYSILKDGFVQCRNNDMIVPADRLDEYDKFFPLKIDAISCAESYAFTLAYNSELMMDLFSSFYNKDRSKPSSAVMQIFGKFMESHPYTFGVEYEAWDGRIPTYICAKNGLIPLRDGSLRHDNVCGYEYATVVMNGLKGMDSIKSQCEALSKFCTFNEMCSTHIHVGSIPKTEDNLVKLYKGFERIQESMFSLFPACLKDTSKYKQKSYCGPLPKMPFDSNAIVKFLSDGQELFGEFGRPHPKDRNGQSKWNISSRYHWMNLCNFYYTGRGTVELRISTPTFNHNKIAALVVLTMSIVRAALNSKFYDDVFALINAEIEEEDLKTWMNEYLRHRIAVLSNFGKIGSGVVYYENMETDNETGTKGPLY